MMLPRCAVNPGASRRLRPQGLACPACQGCGCAPWPTCSPTPRPRVQLRIDGPKTQPRRPRANRPNRRTVGSGKRKQQHDQDHHQLRRSGPLGYSNPPGEHVPTSIADKSLGSSGSAGHDYHGLVWRPGRLGPVAVAVALAREVAHLALDHPREAAQPAWGQQVPQRLSGRLAGGPGQPPRGKTLPGWSPAGGRCAGCG